MKEMGRDWPRTNKETGKKEEERQWERREEWKKMREGKNEKKWERREE